jgi:UDP-N-acetyl-D-galactosamine dehydrogenase
MLNDEKIVVLGLGNVGLPLAVSLAATFPDVVGFDVSERRVAALQGGKDWTGEIADEDLSDSSLTISADKESLRGATFYIVTVPTPVDADRRPDLGPIRSACELVAPYLTKNAIVVFESTVYPGVTEEFCAPLLEQGSCLVASQDFFLGYSPERINPGDMEHRLETITKVVSADSPEALQRVKAVYGGIIKAGLHVAPSIKVAEAAKVIENTQRDITIALMNEIALIFDKMGIRTKEVLKAAGTKWNFLPFSPGLVGGHCIGVDPYYLTSAAEKLGYRPEVILAGRRINDSMGQVVAGKTVKLLIQAGIPINGARVGVLGLTFKEDVPDLRNSKVPDIIAELAEFGITALVHDVHAQVEEAQREYSIALSELDALADLDALIVAVNHRQYVEDLPRLFDRLRRPGIFVDVKSVADPDSVPDGIAYWSL